MAGVPTRVVTDSMIGLHLPDIAVCSPRVAVVLGQNPGWLTGPGTNTYLLGTGRHPLLIDAGTATPAYAPLLARALRDIRRADSLQGIALTHAHPDHRGGVEGVRQAVGPAPVLKKPWPDHDDPADMTALDDGAEIATDGATLRAIWTPGHATDHLCFYLAEEGALFTGDLVLGAGTTVIPPDGDLGDYLQSLRRLLALDAAVIYPGHGPAIHDPRAKIEAYLAHRALRDEQILEALRAGVHTVPALVERIYTDVPSMLHGAAAWSVEAHLRKLEREGVAEHAGDEWFRR